MEEEEKNERNHEEIIIRANHYNKAYTIIEQKLPNPYLITEFVKNKKYINYNIKSKFKSKFADYLNKKNKGIRQNKTYKFSNMIDKYIYFTNIPINKLAKKSKALTNKEINLSEKSSNIKNEQKNIKNK